MTDWKPCVLCKGRIIQKRTAYFICLSCGQNYIADAEDMREDGEDN